MQALLHCAFILCTVKLGNDDGCTGGKACEKTNHQIDDLRGRAANTGESAFAKKMAYNDCINGII